MTLRLDSTSTWRGPTRCSNRGTRLHFMIKAEYSQADSYLNSHLRAEFNLRAPGPNNVIEENSHFGTELPQEHITSRSLCDRIKFSQVFWRQCWWLWSSSSETEWWNTAQAAQVAMYMQSMSPGKFQMAHLDLKLVYFSMAGDEQLMVPRVGMLPQLSWQETNH